jgi:catechol 2,3-dioxygenase-like lactoylglutathione lyase family enzyme
VTGSSLPARWAARLKAHADSRKFGPDSVSDGLCSIPVDHLALAVSDQDRSRRFYETYLGFGAEPSYRASDGTLFIFDGAGFSLALGVVSESIRLPPFLHFGKGLASPEAVRRIRDRLIHDGVPIVDWWDEPDYVSVKCADPDGYVVELSWEPPAESAASTSESRSRSTGG